MNELDKSHPIRSHYYRRVRNALIAAGAIHIAAFAAAPPYRPAPPVMKADPLRLLPAELGIRRNEPPGFAASAAGVPSGGQASAIPAALGRIVASESREVRAEQWAPPAAAGSTGGGRGQEGAGFAESEAPPVYYGYDTEPRALKVVEPVYPTAARDLGYEGTVIINVNLDERGRILRAWVASASASELLVTTALDAVYQFEFAPGLARGVPVRSTVAIPFRFTLKKTS